MNALILSLQHTKMAIKRHHLWMLLTLIQFAQSADIMVSTSSLQTTTSRKPQLLSTVRSENSRSKTVTDVIVSTGPGNILSVNDSKYLFTTPQSEQTSANQNFSKHPYSQSPTSRNSSEFETEIDISTTVNMSKLTSNRANFAQTLSGTEATTSKNSVDQKPFKSTGYDKELTIIFAVTLSLMIVVVIVLCIIKKRRVRSLEKYMLGGGDIMIQSSTF